MSIILMTHDAERPISPAKANPSPPATAIAAQIIPTTPSLKPTADLYIFPPESSAAKLTPSELKSLIQDNPAAAAYAQDITGDLNFGYIAIRIAKKWAADDPLDAVFWAQALPAGAGHDAAVKVIFVTFGTKDFAAALALAQSLPADGSNTRALALESLAGVVKIANITNPAKAAAMRASLGQN